MIQRRSTPEPQGSPPVGSMDPVQVPHHDGDHDDKPPHEHPRGEHSVRPSRVPHKPYQSPREGSEDA